MAAVVVVPTFMEVLDTTIAVVALRYIAGGLSATVDDGEWVLTSYLAANAIILPITGWLSAHLGRRNYFLLSIAVFTLEFGAVRNGRQPRQLILFRVHPGSGGRRSAALQPGRAARRLPREKQGVAMTLFGFAALLAPVVGPTLGRLDNRQLPVALGFPDQCAGRACWRFAGCYAMLRDPDYLDAEREELKNSRSISTRSVCRCWSSSWSAGR